MNPPFISEGLPSQFLEPERAARIARVAESFERLLGRSLVARRGDVVNAMWCAPRAILAHGVEADPILFFGNRRALQCFEADVASFLAMPSRLTAEAPLRAQRQALLDRVSAHGFIDDYAGIRVSLSGKCFRIENAIVWNVLNDAGEPCGQAATFEP